MHTYRTERGLFELRRGRPIFISTSYGRPWDGGLLAASVETLTPTTLALLRRLGTGSPALVLTRYRAASIGLTDASANGRRPGDISLALAPSTTPEEIRCLSEAIDPPGVDVLRPRAATGTQSDLVALARFGHLLPAIVVVSADPESTPELESMLDDGAVLPVGIDEVRSFVRAGDPSLSRVSEALVPLRRAESAQFVLFREDSGLREHVAILIGDPCDWPDPVPVRLHSACLTGDLFDSLRCDCGEQLRGSIEAFAAKGGGALLYLSQEGRGIGLANKLRAYTLQEGGLDTVDADCTLGFGPDEREYGVAVEMLRQLDIERIELFTNNPEKIGALAGAGISVVGRYPLYGTVNRHNRPYMRTKVHRAGHLMGEVLSRSARPD